MTAAMPSQSPAATPAVSVVMPVYNGARYLQAAVDSVLGQSFTDFELIVVDDGSTDATSQILASYCDPRLVVAPMGHAGLISALNRGMQMARADLVARMDADDICEPDRLAKQVAFLAAHPEVAVVATAANVIDAEGAVVDFHPPFDDAEPLLAFAAGNPVVHGSVLMRKTRLPTPVYRMPPEDYVLWIDLIRTGRKLACMQQPLYRFRKHAESYSIAASRSQSSAAVDVLQWILETCPTDKPTSREKMLVGWGMTAGYAFRSGRRADATKALARFCGLAQGPWDATIDKAVERGVGFVIWGGCPLLTALKLKILQLRRHPLQWKSYRELLGVVPALQWLRRKFRRP